MRTIPTNLNTELVKTHGVEAITVVEIQWNPDGANFLYSDRVTSFATGKILDMSRLDFVINVDSGSDSAEIELTLDDTNGEIKGIMDTLDIHKKKVWVYQYVTGTTYPADRALVFSGEISSPILWSEGARTVSFSVISKIEDAEVGFSIEEGQFVYPDSDLIGKPWPLKFGSTTRVPALRLKSPVKGILATATGIKDPTLSYRLEKAGNLICPIVFQGYVVNQLGLSAIFTPVYTEDGSCASNRCSKVKYLQTLIAQQSKYEYNKLRIIDGDKFPQGQVITLDIEGGKFTGVMNGSVFTVQTRTHPDAGTLLPLTDQIVQNLIDAEEAENAAAGCGPGSYLSNGTVYTGYVPPKSSYTNLYLASRSFEFFNKIPTGSFFWAEAGSEVTLDTGDEIIYIANILPETVHQVQAYRNFDSGRKLVAVPSQYYSVRTTDYVSYSVTEIVFSKPLSNRNAQWEDEIYVNSTSTIGPNTVDIMEWLIETYTTLSIDTTSFDYVRTRLDAYPSDFPLLERKNILEVLREIAFQCRCAIYLRNDTFYLKYLSEIPTSISTITPDDIDVESLVISHTSTEEIVTKLVANWQWDYSLEKSNKIILRHNIEKYGTQEESYDFYIYRELDYVHKSATFWLLRKANTWKYLSFSTALHKFLLETFDGVTLDIDHLSADDIRALITKADYNSATNTLDFEIWTPVRSGENTTYDFAYPADIEEELEWPTESDRAQNLIGSGSAPGFVTEAPSGHPLNATANLIQGVNLGPCKSQTGVYEASVDYSPSWSDQTCGGGNGDTYPSDEGDTAKPRDTEDGSAPDSPVDTSDIQVDLNRESDFGNTELQNLRERLAQLEQQQQTSSQMASNANEAAGGEGSSGEFDDLVDELEKLPDPDDLPEGSCDNTLIVSIYHIDVVWKDGVGPASNTPGDTGTVLTATLVGESRIRFQYCCEMQEMQSKISARKTAKSLAAAYVVGEVDALNSIGFCSTDPSCPPSPEVAQKPTPVAYRKTPVVGREEDAASFDGAGLMDELGLEECGSV